MRRKAAYCVCLGHGMYIYAEQGRILLESITDGKELLSIPGPVTNLEWDVFIAPSVSKNGLVYVFFGKKIVLIDVKSMKSVQKESSMHMVI